MITFSNCTPGKRVRIISTLSTLTGKSATIIERADPKYYYCIRILADGDLTINEEMFAPDELEEIIDEI